MNDSDQSSTPADVKNFTNVNKQQKINEEANLRNLTRKLKQSDILRDDPEQISDQTMEIEEKIPYTEIRKRLPTIWDQYRFVVDKQKIYLPKWKTRDKKPKWATEKYLVNVMLKKNFGLDLKNLKKPEEPLAGLTKGEMINILEQLVNKPLGFEEERNPPKKWLITVIYSLKPDHEMFKPVTEEITKTIPRE